VVEVFTVPISKAQFRRLPQEERALIFVCGHILNQISVFMKLVRFSTNHDPPNPVEAKVSGMQSQIILRCLMAVLSEACVYFEKREVIIGKYKAHPVVPGSPICGMRMPCGGRLRRAREGIEWLRAIGVSTVPRGPKGRRTATGMPTSGSRHHKTGNPAPFQISPATPIC
jgi:CRISPR/Cas system-associated protein endoribonuclease Cas2